MKFCATRAAPDGEYNEVFEAAGWKEAREYCRARSWRLDGEVKMQLRTPRWFGAVVNWWRRQP